MAQDHQKLGRAQRVVVIRSTQLSHHSPRFLLLPLTILDWLQYQEFSNLHAYTLKEALSLLSYCLPNLSLTISIMIQ